MRTARDNGTDMHDILVNWSPQETRVAIIENGAIQHEAPAQELAADPVPLERYIGVHR